MMSKVSDAKKLYPAMATCWSCNSIANFVGTEIRQCDHQLWVMAVYQCIRTPTHTFRKKVKPAW